MAEQRRAVTIEKLSQPKRSEKEEQFLNCWEFKNCGREEGGRNVRELGVCPAYPDHGRDCAYLAGTLCGGKAQGSFAMKISTCMSCDFYKSPHFQRRYLTS